MVATHFLYFGCRLKSNDSNFSAQNAWAKFHILLGGLGEEMTDNDETWDKQEQIPKLLIGKCMHLNTVVQRTYG